MKLKFLAEIPLETLRNNVENNLSNYLLDTNDWIFDFFEKNNPFLELSHEFPDFTLNTSEEKPSKTDFENIRTLYTSLKSLSIIEATNENLWAGLAHSTFWNYMKYRIGSDGRELTEKLIKNNYFFSNGKRRSLIKHPLSRLWWAGYLTYDKDREDPFELLNVFRLDFSAKINYIFSSNFSNSDKIRKAFLSAIYEFEKNGVQIKREVFNQTIMYLNILGGTYLLDYFEEEELKEKITKKIDTLLYSFY